MFFTKASEKTEDKTKKNVQSRNGNESQQPKCTWIKSPLCSEHISKCTQNTHRYSRTYGYGEMQQYICHYFWDGSLSFVVHKSCFQIILENQLIRMCASAVL